MAKRPFFSVVMPVYGVEHYLEASVNSVLAQTYQDFEIILVDDCSPDRSGEICDELKEKDTRISVIHLPQNGGLSNARNQGFQAVTGQYVFFMDSDDTIEDSLFATVQKALAANPAEVTVFGIHVEFFDEKDNLSHTSDITWGKDEFFTSPAALREKVIDLEKMTLYGYAWNKIYAVDYLRQLGAQFRTITLIEDILFNVEVFHNIQKLNILNVAPYNYKKRLNESLTNKFVADYYALHKKRVQMIYDQYTDWGLCTAYVQKILADLYARYIFSALQRNCDSRAQMTHFDRKQWIKSVLKDPLWQTLSAHVTVGLSLQGILSFLLKHHLIFSCLAAGRFIYFVKTKLPVLFAKVK